MSYAAQKGSPHRQFQHSPHNQRIIAVPPRDPPPVEFELMQVAKGWHGFRYTFHSNPIEAFLEGPYINRARYLKRDFSGSTSTFEGAGYAPQGTPGDLFYPDFNGSVDTGTELLFAGTSSALVTAANSLPWDIYGTGNKYIFDEHLDAHLFVDPLDTSGINPAAYTGAFINTPSGFSVNSVNEPNFQPRPEPPFTNPHKYLVSQYWHEPSNISAYYAFILCSICRFKPVGIGCSYWLGVADFASSGTYPTYPILWGAVEVLESGSVAADTWKEIDFPTGFASDFVNIYSPGDSANRLSWGKAVFAILNESPAAWSARTGIALA